MVCPKCNRELMIDRMDTDGRYWYVCINPSCPDFRKAFNPGTGDVSEASIKAKDTPRVIYEYTDDAE